mmetsp:Transcript_19401/g.63238  ORF Transcript_19401/g.63238 Transcript_19401/m.63238 type:complete len:260 (+) Transcript_19401:1568-2347(+)
MGPSSESESDRTSSHSESEPCDANSAAAIAGAAAAGLSTAPAPISRTPDEARAVSAAGSASSHFPAAAAAVPGSTDAQGVVSPAAPQPPPTEPDGALMAPRSAMSSMPEQTAIASSPWILASFSRNRSSDGSHGLGRDVWARLLTSEVKGVPCSHTGSVCVPTVALGLRSGACIACFSSTSSWSKASRRWRRPARSRSSWWLIDDLLRTVCLGERGNLWMPGDRGRCGGETGSAGSGLRCCARRAEGGAAPLPKVGLTS